MSPKPTTKTPAPGWDLLRSAPPPPTLPMPSELSDLLSTMGDAARVDILRTYITQVEETRRLAITQAHNTRRARNEQPAFWAVPIIAIVTVGIVLCGGTCAWHDVRVTEIRPPTPAPAPLTPTR